MKFRTLILASLMTLIFSACAGPTTDMDPNNFNVDGIGEESSDNIGDLIGNLGGDIESDDDLELDEGDDNAVLKCRDPRAKLTADGCICPAGLHIAEDGFCHIPTVMMGSSYAFGYNPETTCEDPDAELSDGECVCKKYYAKNPDEKCVKLEANTTIGYEGESREVDFPTYNTVEENDATIYVDELYVTIKTGSKKYSGTNANISFRVNIRDGEDDWTLFDKEGNDFEKNDKDTYTHRIKNPVPLNEIIGFTLLHHGKSHPLQTWLIAGIKIKAHFVDIDGNPIDTNGVDSDVIYYNPWVLRWVLNRKIEFTMNDIAVMANIVTDSKHHNEEYNGEDVKSGTDFQLFLDIALSGPKKAVWGKPHDVQNGPILDHGNHELNFLLDWKYENNNDRGDNETYADFISLNNIKDFKPYSTNLRINGEAEGGFELGHDYTKPWSPDTDGWRPASLESYIFKPARVFRKERGERACWHIKENMSDGETILEPEETNPTYFPLGQDCTELIKNKL